MSGDGEERAVGSRADEPQRRPDASGGDPPLADLTADGPSPLEDLGAPWEGPAPGSSLPDLTGGARGGADGADLAPAATSDDEWAPATRALEDVASPYDDADVPGTPARPSGAGTPGDVDPDWAPLPDLGGRRGRSTGSRRGRGRAGDTTAPRGRRRERPADPPSSDPEGSTNAPDPPAAAETHLGSPREDGLPPGALGAGASGRALDLGLFADGPVGETPAAAGNRPARGKGGRRRRRGDDAGGDAAGDAPATPERPLTAEERLQHALTLAYRHLSKRDRTVSEVRTHLAKREIDEASIVGALAELTEFGYVDDERYATRFVEDKRRLEGWGRLRIEQGLRRTGIPREVADRALEDDPLRGDEDELAVEALEQRLAGRALEDDRARQKALRLLATKGYTLETSYAAVRTYERRCAEREDG